MKVLRKLGFKMEEFNSKDQQIFEDMKQCVKDFGLKILDEMHDVNIISGFSMFEYGNYNMGITFSYDTANNLVQVFIQYADMPAEKLPALYELLNHINGHLIFNHFHIDGGTRILVLLSGMKVTGYFLRKEAFKMILAQNLGIGHTFMPLIGKLLATDENPQSIMDTFNARKNMMTPEFLGPDGKLKVGKMTAECPFIIEASADMPAFSTHTHGLTELGWPEFLIDHLAFGGNQNSGLINASYEYFIKPENAGQLDAIRKGETVKLKGPDLKPSYGHPDPHIYCYRRVCPEFEMVKKAYVIESPEDIDPAMWFVQIYVEGDDFALTDEYYKGGIKW
jgi:hypothetical protein